MLEYMVRHLDRLKYFEWTSMLWELHVLHSCALHRLALLDDKDGVLMSDNAANHEASMCTGSRGCSHSSISTNQRASCCALRRNRCTRPFSCTT